MTDLRTAAQQALEALEYHVAPPSAPTWSTTAAITALRAALAQPEPVQEPLPLTDLQAALVLTDLIDRDAIEDPEEYDEGSTLAQVDELYRIIRAATAIRARSKE